MGKQLNGAAQVGYLYRDDLHIVAKLGLGPYGYPDATYAIRGHYAYGTKSNVPDVIVGGPYNPGLYRILSDHLGSVRLVVDASSGAIMQRMDYDAFGKVTSDTNPGFTPFGFAGGLYDPDTKLVRFGARDYDPSVGRWTTKDPTRFAGGLNLYAYVRNDPGDEEDPDGLGPTHNCTAPGFQCALECFELGATCQATAPHPYGPYGPGVLSACKGGWPTNTCTFSYPNGDKCTFLKPGGFALCDKAPPKTSCDQGDE